MSAPRVVIVGGGLAGITAALDCAAAGAKVTLAEVRPRLGGAAYSFGREGLQIDNGQHVFLRCCSAYRRLLTRLGSQSRVELQRQLRIPVLSPGRPDTILARSQLPAPLHLVAALAGYPHLSWRERWRAARAAIALRQLDPDDPALDQRTLGAWLAEHAQSPQAVAHLWDLVALPTLNLPAEEASLALGAFVFQQGLLGHAAAADIGVHTAPLSQVIGAPAQAALHQAGVRVRLGWRAETVLTTSDGFEIEGGDGGLSAEAVIVALPHQRAEGLLPDSARAGTRWPGALASSPIVNLHVVYDRRVFDHRFAAGVDTPVQYLFDRGSPEPGGAAQYLAVSLSAARREMGMSADALREHYLPALAQLLPRSREARVERFLVTREHAATFSARPGTGALRPLAATPVPGLVLAGAWTQTGWPATLEGAVISGHRAAATVLAAVGSPTVTAVTA